ncbi:MAG TPA: D-amino-acid transaminase [Alphaproteobacteria bacterium]|nr:D-amino-acid transaminase [Alphaproteobacteria bacterium]
MSRVAYVNGSYRPMADACVNIEDRGYQFADGVYEVIAVHGGGLIDEEGHLARLGRSLAELQITPPMSTGALRLVMRRVARRNHVENGMIYLQITRGVAPRNHAFPEHSISSCVITAKRLPVGSPEHMSKGVSVIIIPDIRWRRRDIKSISLLPNCLAKQQAAEAGAYEAWMVDEDGMITEGAASNAWIVTNDGELVTREADFSILNGITRLAVIRLAAQQGISFSERAFSREEALAAREAFISASTSLIKPVSVIDGEPVGDGRLGPICRKLIAAYGAHMDSQRAAKS